MRYQLLIQSLFFVFLIGCQNEPVIEKSKDSIYTDPIKHSKSMYPELEFDWQGHRGARGLQPENTYYGFLKALEFEVNTLELDVVVTNDKKVVVSHEPWISSEICRLPNGSEIEDEKALNIYKMKYSQIEAYDCGTKPHERFPEQENLKAPKPLLSLIIEVIDAYQNQTKKKDPIRYNIEIKSKPEWDNIYTPEPKEFVDLVLKETKGILDHRLTLQSFDIRVLEELNRRKGNFKIAHLVENQEGLEANLEKLTFIPDIYSPYFKFLTKEIVEEIHSKGMKVIPWTVNENEDMKSLIDMGVDGIITDYPNKIKNFK